MSVPDRADALVLFGASGDLAAKMIYPALAELTLQGDLEVPVVGVASTDWTDDDLRAHARTSIAVHGRPDLPAAVVDRLAARLRYVPGDYRDASTYEMLAAALGPARRPVFHLAIPPSLFETVVHGFVQAGLHRGARVVVEKPFGRDLASAERLNRHLLGAFDESSVFRIDHFLGKEAVLDVLVLRFANVLLDPVWRREYVDSVQIVMAEDFGVGGRGAFYEQVGALRDVVQNHLLQLLALVAMEPPDGDDAAALRDAKIEVLRAMRPFDPTHVVRGQYVGYRDEPGVAADSQVETFVGLRTEIDSPRWAGVPFFLLAGKRLASTATDIVVEFRRPPRLLFAGVDAPPPLANRLTFRIHPGERVSLTVQAKRPGEEIVSRPIELAYTYDERRDGVREHAYARLLGDAMRGDQRLFARADSVEAAWRVVDPVLAHPTPVHAYAPGSWGPPAAEELVTDHGRWHHPSSDAAASAPATDGEWAGARP